jgi:hypothetical protein
MADLTAVNGAAVEPEDGEGDEEEVEDVGFFDDEVPVDDRAAAEPVPREAGPARAKVRDRWDQMGNLGRAATVLAGLAALVLAAIVATGAISPPAPSAPTVPLDREPVITEPVEEAAPVAAQPERMRVVQSAAQRAPGNPLVGAPDIHSAVVLYAGSDAQLFVNRLNELMSMQDRKDYCTVWFGLAGGWWKITDQRWHQGTAFPNDVYFARVFTGPPCRPVDAVPEPTPPPPAWVSTTTTVEAS